MNKVGVIRQKMSKTGKQYQIIQIGYNGYYIAVDGQIFELEV